MTSKRGLGDVVKDPIIDESKAIPSAGAVPLPNLRQANVNTTSLYFAVKIYSMLTSSIKSKDLEVHRRSIVACVNGAAVKMKTRLNTFDYLLTHHLVKINRES